MRGARHKQYASCAVRFVQEAPHARHLQSTTGALDEKVSIGDNSSGRARKIRCTSNACGCVSTANGALLGLKPHSGESLRIARRINYLRLSPIDDFSPSERPAVCSKGRKGAHKWTQQRQEQSEGTEQKKGGAGSKMRAGGERRSERQGENGINTNGDERKQSMAEEVRTQGRVA